jgi:hypothetical protein
MAYRPPPPPPPPRCEMHHVHCTVCSVQDCNPHNHAHCTFWQPFPGLVCPPPPYCDVGKAPLWRGKDRRARICKRWRSPGIDSRESIPTAYVAWRAGTSNRVVVPARQAWNRFLGFLKGLQTPAQSLQHITAHSAAKVPTSLAPPPPPPNTKIPLFTGTYDKTFLNVFNEEHF